MHTMHCALSLVSKGGNCILKASDVYHTENVKPSMTSKKCFHEKEFLNFQLKRGGPADRFCLRGEGCVYKKKSLKVFLLHNKQNMFSL